MGTYMVEVEEVANVWYEVEADFPEEANHLARRGFGTITDRYATSYRSVCEGWLYRHGLTPRAIFMRPAGDKRRDDVVKAEMYNRHIRGTYDLMAVFDDRQRVVDMWRARGIPCFQVAEGSF